MRAGQIDLLDLEMPLTLRPSARVSDDELMHFSARNKGYKIERNKDGDLTIMTPVGGIGGTHERYVTAMLFIWTKQDGTGIDFGSNTGFNLPDGSCLSPDAAWLRLDRWNALTVEQQEGFPPLCPDFIIEVRFKSDSRRLLEAKMQSWVENGALLAWLVDPIVKNISIYRPGRPIETLDRPATVTADAPVAGFELVCAPLWPAP
jgi:Uma2 family endonuclease